MFGFRKKEPSEKLTEVMNDISGLDVEKRKRLYKAIDDLLQEKVDEFRNKFSKSIALGGYQPVNIDSGLCKRGCAIPPGAE